MKSEIQHHLAMHINFLIDFRTLIPQFSLNHAYSLPISFIRVQFRLLGIRWYFKHSPYAILHCRY